MNKEEFLKHIFKGNVVVELDMKATENRAFAGCYMKVTEVKDWGVIGYVQALGVDDVGGHAYYRAEWGTFSVVGIQIEKT